MHVVTLALAGVAALLAAFFAMTVLNLHTSDPAGNGLAQVWAVGELAVLWILLGALLAIRAFQGAFPGFAGPVVLALYVLSGAAQVASLRLVSQREAHGLVLLCLQVALIASPFLLLARGLWTWGPALPLLLLSLMPWCPLWRTGQRIAAARAEGRAQSRQAEEEQERRMQAANAASLAALKAFSSTTPLSRVIVYTSTEYTPVRDAARERARTLEGRQAEAEAMLGQSDERAFREIAYLDLRNTPALCAGARSVLRKVTEDFAPTEANRTPFDELEWKIAPYRPSIAWLPARGCDCTGELAALEQAVRRTRSTPNRERFLAWLTDVR